MGGRDLGVESTLVDTARTQHRLVGCCKLGDAVRKAVEQEPFMMRRESKVYRTSRETYE